MVFRNPTLSDGKWNFKITYQAHNMLDILTRAQSRRHRVDEFTFDLYITVVVDVTLAEYNISS